MNIALPGIIDQYLMLARSPNPSDADRIAACFSESAEVTDEGETRRGREAIRQWWQGPATKYQYSVEVKDGHELGNGRFVVFTRLMGNFPGGVADLANRFTLEDGLISQLEIVSTDPADP
jgi:hypothetical protein